MARFIENSVEELRIRCDALRGLLHAEYDLELDEIAAIEDAAVSEFLLERDMECKDLVSKVGSGSQLIGQRKGISSSQTQLTGPTTL